MFWFCLAILLLRGQTLMRRDKRLDHLLSHIIMPVLGRIKMVESVLRIRQDELLKFVIPVVCKRWADPTKGSQLLALGCQRLLTCDLGLTVLNFDARLPALSIRRAHVRSESASDVAQPRCNPTTVTQPLSSRKPITSRSNIIFEVISSKYSGKSTNISQTCRYHEFWENSE